jgi:diguanylate cyclase (GGDEF)-like protein
MVHREALERMFAESIKRAQDNNESLVFCMLELNELDEVRAKYGMSAAEHALSTLGQALLTRFRAEDVKGQLSDLFVVIFPRKTSSEVQPALQKFRNELTAAGFGGEIGVNASISYGLAQLNLDTADGMELLDVAFNRLKRTKEQASAHRS